MLVARFCPRLRTCVVVVVVIVFVVLVLVLFTGCWYNRSFNVFFFMHSSQTKQQLKNGSTRPSRRQAPRDLPTWGR